MPASILFVCLGNICRSPMAEGAMRAAAARAGTDITIDSAGTGAWHLGSPPDRRAQYEAARNGVDISGLRARKVMAGDFDRFDHIIAMDGANLAELRAMAPARARARLSLLMDHVEGGAGQSVADPFYGGDAGFRKVWAQVEAGAAGLLAHLTVKNG
ncbi:MAG: low molecular weight protein-tyrosine-phosphatase [Paracoccus sp. (in: a-proteobacteria)]|nr:low molecular weight protein-tyrosine-phosphatase [Paracoccus sp. (in: a-proteobacteria)]